MEDKTNYKELYDALSKRLAEVENTTIKANTYKQLMESVEAAIQTVLNGPQINDIFYTKVRSMNIDINSLVANIKRESQQTTMKYLTEDGKSLVERAVMESRHLADIVSGNVNNLISRPDFQKTLTAAFRAAIVAEPVSFNAMVEELAKDDKGNLGRSLSQNTTFRDSITHEILTRLRDSLA